MSEDLFVQMVRAVHKHLPVLVKFSRHTHCFAPGI
jgi:hypothetical protein